MVQETLLFWKNASKLINSSGTLTATFIRHGNSIG